MGATEGFMKAEIEQLEKENKKLKEVFREEIPRPYSSFINELEEENRNLKNELMEDMKYETELEEKIRFLEQCLDNKEKVNKSMREELQRY